MEPNIIISTNKIFIYIALIVYYEIEKKIYAFMWSRFFRISFDN